MSGEKCVRESYSKMAQLTAAGIFEEALEMLKKKQDLLE
jgi:hypothetical protein